MKKLNNLLALSIGCVFVAFSAWADSPPLPGAAVPVSEQASPTPSLAGSYLSGQFARESGNLDEAINNLRRVHHDDPDNMDIASQLLGMELIQGDIPEAILLAKNIGQQHENRDMLADLLLALDDMKHNDLNTARARMDNVSSVGKVQLWQPLIQGWIDVAQHKLDAPMTAEKFSADMGRAAPLVYYHMALINSAAGFTEEAAKDFSHAIENADNAPERAMRQLLVFYMAHKKPPSLAGTVDHYVSAHPSFSVQGIAPVADLETGVSEILYTMGGVMLGAGVNNDAVIYLQLTLYFNPGMLEAKLALATVFTDMEQYGRASDIYKSITPDNPLYHKAQLQIVINDERVGHLDTALQGLDWMALDPGFAVEALVTKGDLLRLHDRYADAIVAYSGALVRINNPDASVWPVLFARGACYERVGKWGDAKIDLRHALTLEPDQPDVLNYLGYGMIEHGEDVKEARALIEKAYAARSDDPQIIDSMGWALFQSGEYKKSADYLEKAVELLPGDALVNEHLGDAYWRIGRHTEARYQWEQSLSFSPSPNDVQGLNHRIKDGLPPEGALTHTADDAAGKTITPTP